MAASYKILAIYLENSSQNLAVIKIRNLWIDKVLRNITLTSSYDTKY